MASNSASTRAPDAIEHYTLPASEVKVVQAEEIRNMIYELAVDNTTTNIVWTSGNANITTSVKPYAGLARVCKQIRHEFHPIHEEQRLVCIRIEDLEKYLATFFPTDPKVLEEYRGTLTIDIDGFASDNDAGVDLLPLFKLTRTVPKYVWKLVSHSPLTAPALLDEFRGILAHDLTSGSWDKHLNANVARALPSCYYRGVISRIVYHRRSLTAHPSLDISFSDAHRQPYWTFFPAKTGMDRGGFGTFMAELKIIRLRELDIKVGKTTRWG
ncbi:hypothetical protein K505DRAFT_338612 [Melanomma pulvis-pyrius CBS 109.77]|uniref:Uncharacterized protein n=1 Tax=Melanomma pulvis-pyrius CBS 109.77 TaxID=1314802 RepID=A0A6A6X833_9PLEO|nr:hypothetical protein K505DRAFT_338612 [Melanomma pulvis-pyrius CBS 109.77]